MSMVAIPCASFHLQILYPFEMFSNVIASFTCKEVHCVSYKLKPLHLKIATKQKNFYGP